MLQFYDTPENYFLYGTDAARQDNLKNVPKQSFLINAIYIIFYKLWDCFFLTDLTSALLAIVSPKAFAVIKYFLNLVKIDFHDVKWATISEIQQCF